jgi:hypothetical protein
LIEAGFSAQADSASKVKRQIVIMMNVIFRLVYICYKCKPIRTKCQYGSDHSVSHGMLLGVMQNLEYYMLVPKVFLLFSVE